MRVLVAILLAITLLGSAMGEEVSDPSRTNMILDLLTPLQLRPGDSGHLSLALRNPYSWSILNVSLRAEIYAFNGSGGTVEIEDLESPPVFADSGSTTVSLRPGNLAAGDSQRINLAVITTSDTPAGSFFTQGSYFVRFRLEFDYSGGLHAVMVSPGFFSQEQLAFAFREPTPEERGTYRYVGNANYSYLGQVLGLDSIDGLLPDAAFGIRVPMPMWPFYLLIAGAIGSFGMAVYYRRKETGASKSINHRRE